MKRLYILHKLPTPYNDDLFRAIHSDPAIQLQVFHLWRGSKRRPWQSELGTGYPNYYLQTKWGIDWHSLRLALCDRRSLFMIGDWAHFPVILLLLVRIAFRYPVALWVDTPQEHLDRPFWKRMPRAVFLRWLLSNVDVIFGSGKPANRALVGLGAQREKIVDLQFAVDLDRPLRASDCYHNIDRARALRESVGCNTMGVVFGLSGTIDFEKKAQDLGLRAFAQCVKASKIPIGLLIAGTGPAISQLQKMASDLGIADVVCFLGWQEPSEMDTFYMAIDVLLHPAHYDPFPLVILEAMSWSRPVIGTTSSGSVEQRVKNGINGFVVPPNDMETFVAAISCAMHEPQWIQVAKLAARQTAEEWPISRSVTVVKEELFRLIGEYPRGILNDSEIE